jgi:hypothetical protein
VRKADFAMIEFSRGARSMGHERLFTSCAIYADGEIVPMKFIRAIT